MFFAKVCWTRSAGAERMKSRPASAGRPSQAACSAESTGDFAPELQGGYRYALQVLRLQRSALQQTDNMEARQVEVPQPFAIDAAISHLLWYHSNSKPVQSIVDRWERRNHEIDDCLSDGREVEGFHPTVGRAGNNFCCAVHVRMVHNAPVSRALQHRPDA